MISHGEDLLESDKPDSGADGDFLISSPSFLLPKMKDSDELGSWALEMEKEYPRRELITMEPAQPGKRRAPPPAPRPVV